MSNAEFLKKIFRRAIFQIPRCKLDFRALAVAAAIALFLYASSEFQDLFFRSVGFISDFFRAHTVWGVFIFILISGAAVILSPFSSVPLYPLGHYGLG